MYGKFEDQPLPVSDLACERGRADLGIEGVKLTKESCGEYSWERIRIESEAGARDIGRPMGNYDTLTLPRVDTLSEEDIDDAANEVARELCLAADRLLIYPERLLIIGLGNRDLTPDSVGPRAAAGITATLHMMRADDGVFSSLDCSEIAVISPGVTAQSGMDASDIIVGICERIMPDAVIAIDALASKSVTRLGTTIQISDTGIFPGGGIGNKRTPLNEDTLGVPVIAIGVPTVINARHLLLECGAAPEAGSAVDGMFISPREIDGIAEASARIISRGINQAFGIM